MTDANQSAIAEFNAILTSSFAQVMLQRHALVFALGFVPGAELDVASVFVQLVVEAFLEVLVDNTAM